MKNFNKINIGTQLGYGFAISGMALTENVVPKWNYKYYKHENQIFMFNVKNNNIKDNSVKN